MKKVERYSPAQKASSYICSTGVEGGSVANLCTSQSGSDPGGGGGGGIWHHGTKGIDSVKLTQKTKTKRQSQ
jgi:hypothetical protein